VLASTTHNALKLRRRGAHLRSQVRKNYEQDMVDKDHRQRQMGTALYFIDKMALRAGHEKDEDEAETVGCCTLKVRCMHEVHSEGTLHARLRRIGGCQLVVVGAPQL